MEEKEQERRRQIMRKRVIQRRRRVRRLRLSIAGLFIFAILFGGCILLVKNFPKTKEVFAGGMVPFWEKSVDISAIVMPLWVEDRIIEENPYSRPGTPLDEINGIVIHYVGNANTTAEGNNSYFAGLADQSGTDTISVSSHFVIGMDGTVIQNVPITEIAYCSNERNEDTISIETCHPDDTGEFTAETYESLVKLTSWLVKELNLEPDDVIRHYDVTGKACPKYFVDNEDAWLKFKEDVAAALPE